MSEIVNVTWSDVEAEADRIAKTWQGRVDGVYGIPQGGVPLAIMVAHRLGVPVLSEPRPLPVLVVDDLVDSGRTAARYTGPFFDAAFRKPHSPERLAPNARTLDGWLTFPWEKDDGDPTDAVVRLLQHIGEDPSREGLLDTPRRVVKSLRELTVGYSMDPAAVLGTTFDEPQDEMVVVSDIPFASLCEHHLLPFTGTATVAYVPGDRIVGLSKVARLVEVYARRLQVQERMTRQIAESLQDVLGARGVGVVVHGLHSCMANRGVGKRATMTTSALLGVLRTDPAARAEFLGLAGQSPTAR